MKSIKNILGIIVVCILLTGCEKETPEKVVEKTVLKANLLTVNYGIGYFKQLKELQKNEYLKYYDNDGEEYSATYSQYLHKVTIPNLERSLRDIQKLEVNEDSKDLINASIELFEFCIDFYKKDYAEIAYMYDEGKTQQEINQLIKEFKVRSFEEFKEKNLELEEAAKKYAEKKGVNLKFV
ncbi:hypothetical protein HER15_04975 [Tenacibaculum mesophilum]|uniref:Uncharacterized protein n=1 Tax=Tenacibaculum mesophilum TaxID=104268 RepID=A0AAE9MMB6_9FLAO|nr:hypothetical protein [Tenacibaculum mesophilum]UTD14867.1 hypothetical protein HER15_04975 [Tenacibaculum mesophilum]